MRSTRFLKKHLESVIEVEELQYQYPWDKKEFIDYIKNAGSYRGDVMLDEHKQVIGFLLTDEESIITIDNIAVHPSCMRCGIATAMMRKLMSRARRRSCDIEVKVRETNLGGLYFFQSLGFLARCVVPEPFSDSREDAILMKYEKRVKV